MPEMRKGTRARTVVGVNHNTVGLGVILVVFIYRREQKES